MYVCKMSHSRAFAGHWDVHYRTARLILAVLIRGSYLLVNAAGWEGKSHWFAERVKRGEFPSFPLQKWPPPAPTEIMRYWQRCRTSRWISTSGNTGTTRDSTFPARATRTSCASATRCSAASGGRTPSSPTPRWPAFTPPPRTTPFCASVRTDSSRRVFGACVRHTVFRQLIFFRPN